MLRQLITEQAAGLWYPSESDEAVEYVSGASLRDLLPRAGTSYDLERFWRVATTGQDWFTEVEREQVRRFLTLKTTLETHLSNLEAYILGDTVQDIYVLGTNAEGGLEGIHTKMVST